MISNYRNIAIGVGTLFLGLFGWTTQNVLSTQAKFNDKFQTDLAKTQEQVLLIAQNVAVISQQFKDLSLPQLNANILEISGRTSRLEKLLNNK